MSPGAMMMQQWLNQFERDIERGLSAKESGRFVESRKALAGAAEAMYRLAGGAVSERLREQRLRQADEILALLERLPSRDEKRPSAPTREGGSGDGETASFSPADLSESTLRFSDIAGLEEVKEQIRLRMIYPFEHPEAAKRHGLRTGGGILMYGPPGTGKTMIARATAGELGAAFFTVKPSEIMSKWVGEAEQNVRALFAEARKRERAVIFIDEIESLVPARGDSNSTVMQRVVPQFLAELEGFEGGGKNSLLFMGATNEPWAIDPAMLRPGRFDVRIYLGLPDEPARRWLLEKQFSGRAISPDVDWGALAARTEGYSGADIRALAERAAQEAFQTEMFTGQPTPCDNALLERCLAAVRPSVTRKQLAKLGKWHTENT